MEPEKELSNQEMWSKLYTSEAHTISKNKPDTKPVMAKQAPKRVSKTFASQPSEAPPQPQTESKEDAEIVKRMQQMLQSKKTKKNLTSEQLDSMIAESDFI